MMPHERKLAMTGKARFHVFFVFVITVIAFPFNLASAGQDAYVSLLGGYFQSRRVVEQ